MCNFVTMKERINWIDWVKATCMTVVVLCHCPQQEDAFHLQYLASVILSSFFFVSGYLKKPLATNGATLKKYGYALLIPYLIYKFCSIFIRLWFRFSETVEPGLQLHDHLDMVFEAQAAAPSVSSVGIDM